ncbi:MAG TPA: hypothetical protein VK735_24100 [Pseudonocardia sp.]|uniref:hypothetical protein n=1 Tax=Pseudonocardia sp. TaxID=60912 RepID=UPI002D0D17BF|nr:hypothetical protein [Pseudonocardia sp.]HTF50535.1 hypothetical protein [Pseudonocardia sp.]
MVAQRGARDWRRRVGRGGAGWRRRRGVISGPLDGGRGGAVRVDREYDAKCDQSDGGPNSDGGPLTPRGSQNGRDPVRERDPVMSPFLGSEG